VYDISSKCEELLLNYRFTLSSEQETPQPNLFYALECLENAAQLVNLHFHTSSKGGLHVKPSNPIINSVEITALHAAILSATCYCALSLDNIPLAIKKSMELLSLPGIPGAYR